MRCVIKMRQLRQYYKKVCLLISALLLLPIIIMVRCEELLGSGERIFQFFSQLLSLVPSIPGSYFRKAYYWSVLEHVSWDIHIDFGSYFPHREISIGKGVIIGAYSIIGCSDIGENEIGRAHV